LSEFPRIGAESSFSGDNGPVGGVRDDASLRDRAQLLREINLSRQRELESRQVFLVVINIADTKRYDEIIRVFGYKFADDLLSIRLLDLDFISAREPTFRVGFWSVGLIFNATNQQDYESSLNRLIEVLARPVICRGIPVFIQAGVGICDLALGLGAAEDLLQATFLAGQIGAQGSAGWSECNYDLADDHRRAFALIAHAAHSLSTPYEFELNYQARVELSSWRCFAAEALLRWRHPTLGMVMPAEFIPLIEMTGLVREMTNWVLSRALAQLAKWHSEGLGLQVCVNISSKNLEEPDFVTRLVDLLELNRIDPKFLELEFSDEHSFDHADMARQHLSELRGLGVSIAIDDFGAGTNGFASIENLAADVIKIDRRLIRAMLDSPRQQAVVQTIIDMGHRLGMKVVAEGLENPATLKLLHGWGCEAAQGFLINRPMPAETFAEWLGRKFIA
jgi:EAL domain-containing protein (putative c-di-GMP-specific phosphodiesterase class I)